MIDFRYHLVSIISIFMALAVGIVLGAGPLQGQIGDTLNSVRTGPPCGPSSRQPARLR